MKRNWLNWLFLGSLWCMGACQRAPASVERVQEWSEQNQLGGLKIQARAPMSAPSGAQTSLLVLVTSDLHAWITQRTLEPRETPHGLAHLFAKLQNLRQTTPNSLLLDGGDTLGGPTNVPLYGQTPSLPIITLMNVLGYDAAALGNHDLEPPIEVFTRAFQDSHFPWLAANLQLSAGGTWLRPYAVFERGGLRIGVLGMITPGLPMWTDPQKLAGLEVRDMRTETASWVKILREIEQVDLLIGLFHSGTDLGYDRRESQAQGIDLPNVAGWLADHQEGLDLIIAGHAHQTFPRFPTGQLIRYRTPVVAPGAEGKGFSRIEIQLAEHQGRWRVIQTRYTFEPAASTPAPEALQLVEESLQHSAIYWEAPLPIRLKNLPHKSELWACGQELSRVALSDLEGGPTPFVLLPGNWRGAELSEQERGQPLRRRHLWQWMPYENHLIQASLYGRQIEGLLEPYQRQQMKKSVIAHSLLIPLGFTLKALPEVKDQKKEITPPVHWEIRDTGGNLLEGKQRYPVWLSQYHWYGGGGLMGANLIHPSQKLKESPETLRERIFNWLQRSTAPLPSDCMGFLEKESDIVDEEK